jgi:C4-type Zn-finger protein
MRSARALLVTLWRLVLGTCPRCGSRLEVSVLRDEPFDPSTDLVPPQVARCPRCAWRSWHPEPPEPPERVVR